MKPKQLPEPTEAKQKWNERPMSDLGKFIFEQAKIHHEIYMAGLNQADIFNSTRNQITNHLKDEK